MRYHNIGRLWAECMSKLEICHPAPGTLKINMKWAGVPQNQHSALPGRWHKVLRYSWGSSSVDKLVQAGGLAYLLERGTPADGKEGPS